MIPSVLLNRSVVAAVGVLAAIGGACGSSDTAPGDQAGTGGEDGALVYAANCASCHGSDLRGTEKGPSHLSIVYEPNHHSDGAFRSAIANGAPQHHWNFGDMESVDGLSDAEVDSVIAFIRSEQERLGLEG